MLLAYGFRNFFSFKEDVEISFRLDANCPAAISRGNDFSHVLGIKGANGSGKTQLLKGLSFLNSFCTASFSKEPESPIPLSPFFNSKEPSFFFADFRIDSVDYRYELLCTIDNVVSEILYRTAKKKIKVFERVGNEIISRISSFKALDNIKLRKNASIISTSHQYEMHEMEKIYDFFDLMEANVGFAGFHQIPNNIDFVSKFIATSGDEKLLPFIIEFIRDCDTGISDIEIRSFVDKTGELQYHPIFIHKAGDINHPVTAFTESSGTKALFQVLTSYHLARAFGGILIVDEFDINLHPLILPRLISLFDDQAKNPHNAQLIFATHDSEILDILGRYRTYLVGKDENESFAYRLDEIPGDILRNDRPIRPVYLSGRIGGVPRDLESL